MAEKSLLHCVGSQNVKRIVQFRVKEEADLLKGIEEAVKRGNIRTGVIISGMGALTKGVFRNLRINPRTFPVQDADRLYLDLEAPLELVSLGGWIATGEDGKTHIHCHFSASTVSGDTVVTHGGHLTYGTTAGIKVVIAVAVLEDENVSVVFDESTKSSEVIFR
jgi:predicted DNA-binding protein with PD1-like motif